MEASTSSRDSAADALPHQAPQVEDDEREPLLRRDSEQEPPQRLSGREDIAAGQFEAQRQEAAAQAALDSGWFTWVLVILAFIIFVFWFYVNIRSWYVLFMYYETPCDQPLAVWLLVKLLLDVLSSSAQQRQRQGDPPRAITWLILATQNVWLVLGFHWSQECVTCQTTSPELYSWVKFLVIFGTVVTLFLMLLPVMFYMGVILYVHLVNNGRIKNGRAARDDTLTMLEKVEYNPDLFADSRNPDDNRPSGDCCCCCEDFNAEKTIVRTPCHHYFHMDCLGEWLKLAKTCPICRCDLDIATEKLNKEMDSEAGLGFTSDNSKEGADNAHNVTSARSSEGVASSSSALRDRTSERPLEEV